MLLFFKNLVFTVLVPDTVAVLIPYRIVSGWCVERHAAAAAQGWQRVRGVPSERAALVARTGEGVRGG